MFEFKDGSTFELKQDLGLEGAVRAYNELYRGTEISPGGWNFNAT